MPVLKLSHTLFVEREAIEDASSFSPLIAIVQDHFKYNNDICFWGINNNSGLRSMITDSTVAVWHVNPKKSFETSEGKKSIPQIMDRLMYGSYSANRGYGATHELLVKNGIGNDQMKEIYEKSIIK